MCISQSERKSNSAFGRKASFSAHQLSPVNFCYIIIFVIIITSYQIWQEIVNVGMVEFIFVVSNSHLNSGNIFPRSIQITAHRFVGQVNPEFEENVGH